MNVLITLLIIILAIINLRVIILVLKGKELAFSPNALFALTVVTQMFPQIAVISTNSFYNIELLPRLLVVMILSQLGFFFGFKFGKKKVVHRENIVWDFSLGKIMPLLFLFTIAGLVAMPFYRNLNTVYGGINVVLGFLRSAGFCALILSLICLQKEPKRNVFSLWLIVLFTAIPLFYFGYFVKGSREGLFSLAVVFFVFASLKYTKYRRLISVIFCVIFLFASIIASSITEIRRVNNYKEEGHVSLSKIDYWQNFTSSLIERDITNGMDLGNGAILMNKVSENYSYDYGTGIWNDFIYNFFPARIFGSDLKELLSFSLFDDEEIGRLVGLLTHGISTRTGYFVAFQSFSYFGALLFFAIGFILARLSLWATVSNFYFFAYVACLAVIPNMLTHSTQYVLARLELIFIFFMPLFLPFIKKKIFKIN